MTAQPLARELQHYKDQAAECQRAIDILDARPSLSSSDVEFRDRLARDLVLWKQLIGETGRYLAVR